MTIFEFEITRILRSKLNSRGFWLKSVAAAVKYPAAATANNFKDSNPSSSNSQESEEDN